MESELQQAAEIYNLITEFLVNYSFQIVGALIILGIGFYVARKLSELVQAFLVKREIDITLSRFTASGVKLLIMAMVVIMALGKVGISITPFVAAVGAISLGAGLALQGLLSNYGAGVSIVVARPFTVGDTISVQGVTGVVKEVHLGTTILSNEDGVLITIPNKHIIGEIIHNSHADSIVEYCVGVAYDSDPELTVKVILDAIKSEEGISTGREPQVGIDSFGDSSLDIGVRYWVLTERLFDTRYRVNMAIFKALAANNIEIPFPQRYVHLYSHEG